jgi:hypothetical protein
MSQHTAADPRQMEAFDRNAVIKLERWPSWQFTEAIEKRNEYKHASPNRAARRKQKAISRKERT